MVVHVPYHVHTDHIHHHHVKTVPVYKPVPVVKHVPVISHVPVPIVKEVHVPVHHYHEPHHDIPVSLHSGIGLDAGWSGLESGWNGLDLHSNSHGW